MRNESFEPQKLQEERDKETSKVIPVRLNVEELRLLEDVGRLIEQEKLSTVIKQLMRIGVYAIHTEQTTYIIDTLFKNRRNNKRVGISVVDPKFKHL